MADLRATVDIDSASSPLTSLRFSTRLVGALDDGGSVELDGSGVINELEGLTLGEFEIRKLPKSLTPPALGPFLFTGYPNACAAHSTGEINPFWGLSYSYERRYYFRASQDIAVLEVECELDRSRNQMTSTFCLGGSVPRLSHISSVTPITESWAIKGIGLAGRFHVGWQSSAGPTIEAEAISTYALSPKAPIAGSALRRHLRLTSTLDASGRLFVEQRSHLVPDLD